MNRGRHNRDYMEKCIWKTNKIAKGVLGELGGVAKKYKKRKNSVSTLQQPLE